MSHKIFELFLLFSDENFMGNYIPKQVRDKLWPKNNKIVI